MAKGIKRKLALARKNIELEIQAHRNRGGIYAQGLAGEGYNGGYRDAIDDVMLALNGVTPQRHWWWEDSTPDAP